MAEGNGSPDIDQQTNKSESPEVSITRRKFLEWAAKVAVGTAVVGAATKVMATEEAKNGQDSWLHQGLRWWRNRLAENDMRNKLGSPNSPEELNSSRIQGQANEENQATTNVDRLSPHPDSNK